jgi:hypothetical protein
MNNDLNKMIINKTPNELEKMTYTRDNKEELQLNKNIAKSANKYLKIIDRFKKFDVKLNKKMVELEKNMGKDNIFALNKKTLDMLFQSSTTTKKYINQKELEYSELIKNDVRKIELLNTLNELNKRNLEICKCLEEHHCNIMTEFKKKKKGIVKIPSDKK